MRLRDLSVILFILVRSFTIASLFLLDLEGELFHINVKAHFRPNMSNSIRSTCVSPQLEANTRIPARQTPFRLGLSRRQC